MAKTFIQLVHTDTLSCEAICRQAPNGALIIVAQNGGTMEPAIENRVYAFHSQDQGRTWSKTGLVHPEDGRAVYCTELFVHHTALYAFLTLHNGRFLDFESVVMVSHDSGYTWQKAPLVLPLEGFVFIRGVLKRSDGRLVIPYQQYRISAEENARLVRSPEYVWKANIDTVYNGVLLVGDDLKTIEHGGIVPISLYQNGTRRWQWPEPTLVELSDQTLVMFLRVNHTNRLYESRSYDGGKTFGPLHRTRLKNPGNKPKLIPLPDGRIALLNTFTEGTRYIDRQPLSVWISDDDMQTWSYKRQLVRFPGWHAYPDGVVSPDGSKLWLAFEFNRHDIYFIEHTLPSKRKPF